MSALKTGFNAENSNAFIAEGLGLSETSVKRSFSVFRREGLDAVLERGYGIGRPSDMDEEVEAYLLNGLTHSRWNTAEQAREGLSNHFERSFKYHTVSRICICTLNSNKRLKSTLLPDKATDHYYMGFI